MKKTLQIVMSGFLCLILVSCGVKEDEKTQQQQKGTLDQRVSSESSSISITSNVTGEEFYLGKVKSDSIFTMKISEGKQRGFRSTLESGKYEISESKCFWRYNKFEEFQEKLNQTAYEQNTSLRLNFKNYSFADLIKDGYIKVSKSDDFVEYSISDFSFVNSIGSKAKRMTLISKSSYENKTWGLELYKIENDDGIISNCYPQLHELANSLDTWISKRSVDYEKRMSPDYPALEQRIEFTNFDYYLDYSIDNGEEALVALGVKDEN